MIVQDYCHKYGYESCDIGSDYYKIPYADFVLCIFSIYGTNPNVVKNMGSVDEEIDRAGGKLTKNI